MPILDLTVSQGGSCKLPASPLIDQLSALVRSGPHANAQEKKVHRNQDSQRGLSSVQTFNNDRTLGHWPVDDCYVLTSTNIALALAHKLLL